MKISLTVYTSITKSLQRRNDTLSKLSIDNNIMLINTKSRNYRIAIKDIIYIESDLRTVNIFTVNETYYCYERLDKIEKQLNRFGFIRCHQSYLVQADYIICYDNHTLQLKDTDFSVPVSRRCQKNIRLLIQEKNEHGILTCIDGLYTGYIVSIEPEQPIMIGRDGNVADIIIQLPMVSRLHCKLIYHEERGEYEITDFSSNGTFIHNEIRLIPNHNYILEPGSEICFGDRTNIFKVL